jgi:biofilm PGA synthesis lipoprotein PgaB
MRGLVMAILLVAAVPFSLVGVTHAADTGPFQSSTASSSFSPGSFIALSFHEVRDDVRDYPDPFAVDSDSLVKQFEWLRGNGYVPVSLDQIVAARQGGRPLPPKAILLTFDDAYASFYTRVYPLLLAFRIPAVLAVVGRWTDSPPGTPGIYGEKDSVPDANFASWAQIREMSASGLVEIASHSYDLHRGVPGNPQGNLQAGATTRIYDAASRRYEDDAAWRARVSADLARSVQGIERETGRRPRAVVWPYGSYNNELVKMAGDLGMPIALTLDDGVNTDVVPLGAMRRILIEHNPTLADFAAAVRGPVFPEPIRVVQVNLDNVYNPDDAVQERNLSNLLDRIKHLKPSHVLLQATADTNGDGLADASYFPARHLPMRADLFNRVAWQLVSRDAVRVFAVLPAPDLRMTQEQLADTYGDMARHAHIDGLLFSNGTPPAPGDMARFVESTQLLADAARRWRAPLTIARLRSIESHSPSGTAASLVTEVALLTARSDLVFIRLGTQADSRMIANELVAEEWRNAVDRHQGLRQRQVASKLVFMLDKSSVTNASSGANLARQMRQYQMDGVLNFGYGSDDFSRNDPPLSQTAPVMSLRVDPR